MTSLALTVCAHIAATHSTPRFCAFEYRFLPFPNLTPDPPSALPYASLVVEVMGRGTGMTPAVMPFVSLVVEVMGVGMGMALGVMTYISLVVEVMGAGVGMALGGYALGLAVGGGDGRYHALVLSGAEVNPPESLLVL